MTSTRLRHGMLAAVLSAAVLVGCSTGSAPEAERGQQQDAKKDSVISDMQSTHTWDLINGTPEGTPEESPAP